MRHRFAYLDHPGPIPFAHRGGAGDAPENTLPAFQLAIDLGYRYLETDVQLTADDVLVAFHDNDLLRTTGRPGRISDLPWDQVRSALVDGKEPIPLLEDLLGAFPAARLNIDCKSDRAVDALAATLRRTQSLDRVCLGAFSSTRLRRLRRSLGPRVCTSLGPSEAARWLLSTRIGGLAGMPAVPCAQVPVSFNGLPVVTARTVDRAHRAGMAVHVWTIDEPAEMRRLIALGVDGIMTDRPAVLKQVLTELALWHQ